MNGVLKTRLELVARSHHPDEQESILALLTIGATLALARCNELGGYNMEANVKEVQSELEGVDRTDPVVAAPVMPDATTTVPMADPPF